MHIVYKYLAFFPLTLAALGPLMQIYIDNPNAMGLMRFEFAVASIISSIILTIIGLAIVLKINKEEGGIAIPILFVLIATFPLSMIIVVIISLRIL